MYYTVEPNALQNEVAVFMQKIMPSLALCSCLKHDRRHCITFYTEVIPPKRSTATATLRFFEKGRLPTHRPDSSTYPILNLTNVQVMKSAQMISATSRLVRLYTCRKTAAKQTVPQLKTKSFLCLIQVQSSSTCMH